MIQNLHFEKVSIWLQIDRNPYMVADNRELSASVCVLFVCPRLSGTPEPNWADLDLWDSYYAPKD